MKVKRETQFTIIFISKNVNVSSGEPVFRYYIFKKHFKGHTNQMLIFRVFVTSIVVYINKEVLITRRKH